MEQAGKLYLPGSMKFWISTSSGESPTTVIPRIRSTSRWIPLRWAGVEPVPGGDEDLVLPRDVAPDEQTAEQVGGSSSGVDPQHLLDATVQDRRLEARFPELMGAERGGS